MSMRNVFFWFLVVSIGASVAFTFFRYVILEDFDIVTSENDEE